MRFWRDISVCDCCAKRRQGEEFDDGVPFPHLDRLSDSSMHDQKTFYALGGLIFCGYCANEIGPALWAIIRKTRETVIK